MFGLTGDEEGDLCARCASAVLPLGWAGLDAALRPARRPLERCPVCGTDEPEVERTGLVGCGLCYAIFPEAVARLRVGG